MANLPRAILFDLDDTILVAFGPAEFAMAAHPRRLRRTPSAVDPGGGDHRDYGQLA